MKNILIRAMLIMIPFIGETANMFGQGTTIRHKAEFSINGTIEESMNFYASEGDEVQFPNIPSVYGYKFIGWSRNPIDGNSVNIPNITNVAEEKMGINDVVYYAVFAAVDYTELEKLGNNSILKNGDKIAAFVELSIPEGRKTVKKFYGLYHEATSNGYIDYFILDNAPTISDIVTDPKRSWTITFADNDKWYIGDNNLGYLYNLENSDDFYLCIASRTAFIIDCTDDCTYIKNNSRWFSCRKDIDQENVNWCKFQGGGTKSNIFSGNPQFQLYRLTPNYSTYSTTLPASNLTFAATDGQDYYATFCNYEAVAFPKTLAGGAKLSVEVVNVEDGVISMKDVATDFSCVKDDKVIVPANTGVLLRVAGATVAPTVSYSIFTEQVPGQTSELKSANILIPCLATGKCPAVGGSNRYYRLAYGDFSAKKDLGFWWGAEEGTNDFNVKAGGAVLCVPKSIGSSNIRGFGFNDTGTLTIVDCRADRNNTNAIYNLMGQRVSNTMKGIAIDKGRKVLR